MTAADDQLTGPRALRDYQSTHIAWWRRIQCVFRRWNVVACLTLFVLMACPRGAAETLRDDSNRYSYGVVVDAGSSGTRVRIYRWIAVADRASLPVFTEASKYKKSPGISAFSMDMSGVDEYVRDLLNYTKAEVPESQHSSTPFYVMATAGMRLLLEPRANAVMEEINRLLLDKELNPFLYEERNTRILSGEEEGAFAWIAVNYLRGVFSPDGGVESAGILELGGASTQIAFQHDGAILADKWPMKLAQRSYALYVHSYLYYGQELAVRWAKEYLTRRSNATNGVVENPCMLKGDVSSELTLGRNITFVGMGDVDGCEELIDTYVYTAPDWRCSPKPCAIGSTYQPTLNPDKTFYAVAAFLFNLRDIGALEPDGTFTPSGTVLAARRYCSKSFSQVEQEIGGNPTFLSSNCLMGLYMPALFVKGYGFAADTTKILAVKDVNGESLDWAMGAMIYEHERHQQACAFPPTILSSGSTEATSIGKLTLGWLILLAILARF